MIAPIALICYTLNALALRDAFNHYSCQFSGLGYFLPLMPQCSCCLGYRVWSFNTVACDFLSETYIPC
ncbi:hypothetical protein FPOA_11592 [Fusarium poae]|uniref:Uncharacterized protein n=1 Tax=Fusarium poae TaxID=36050 RepID=A0A1B8AH42_FUSPO|nr:hypothetical protein FPOA_11592 [Fusarium poae]